MSDYHYTLKDIEKRTGLPFNYLARCSSQFADLFFDHQYRTSSSNNKTLFNENGALVFDRIKQLRSEGLNRPEIRAKLEEELPNEKNVTVPTLPNQPSNRTRLDMDSMLKYLVEALEKQHHIVLQAKDETIAELKEKQLLLTDGRSVEEVRSEWQRKRENAGTRTALLSELRKLQSRWWLKKTKRQREIVKALQDLDE